MGQRGGSGTWDRMSKEQAGKRKQAAEQSGRECVQRVVGKQVRGGSVCRCSLCVVWVWCKILFTGKCFFRRQRNRLTRKERTHKEPPSRHVIMQVGTRIVVVGEV